MYKSLIRSNDNVVSLGTTRKCEASHTWRSQKFVEPNNSTLFSHQRNFIEHLLENEEIAFTRSLGLKNSRDVQVAGYDNVSEYNEHYNSADDKVNGKLELFLYTSFDDISTAISIATTYNRFFNNMHFYAKPVSSEHWNIIEHCDRNYVNRVPDHLIIVDEPMLVRLDFGVWDLSQTLDDKWQKYRNCLWLITHVHVVSSFGTVETSSTPLATYLKEPFDYYGSECPYPTALSSSDTEGNSITTTTNTSSEDEQSYDDDRGDDDRDDVDGNDDDDDDNNDNNDDRHDGRLLCSVYREQVRGPRSALSSLTSTLVSSLVSSSSSVSSPPPPSPSSSSSLPGHSARSRQILTRHTLIEMTVPRSFMNTVVYQDAGTGKNFSIVSLCLYGDSRNNWIFVRSLLFDRWIEVFSNFLLCKYHCVRSLIDLLDFKNNYSYYAKGNNIILIDSKLIDIMYSYKNMKAYRVFYCDQRFRRKLLPLGCFNYVFTLSSRLHFEWFAGRRYVPYNSLSVHASTIDTMYDRLPPIIFLEPFVEQFRSDNSLIAPVLYDPNVKLSTRENNEKLFYGLLKREYDLCDMYYLNSQSCSADQKQSFLLNYQSVMDNIEYLRQKMLTSVCSTCLSREHDYFIPKCCRNPICLVCFHSLTTLSCPSCRAEFYRNCLIPVMLTDSERTENSSSVDVCYNRCREVQSDLKIILEMYESSLSRHNCEHHGCRRSSNASDIGDEGRGAAASGPSFGALDIPVFDIPSIDITALDIPGLVMSRLVGPGFEADVGFAMRVSSYRGQCVRLTDVLRDENGDNRGGGAGSDDNDSAARCDNGGGQVARASEAGAQETRENGNRANGNRSNGIRANETRANETRANETRENDTCTSSTRPSAIRAGATRPSVARAGATRTVASVENATRESAIEENVDTLYDSDNDADDTCASSASCRGVLVPKIVIVDYEKQMYRRIVNSLPGYQVFQCYVNKNGPLVFFKQAITPAVLIVNSKHALTGLDLSYVTHLFLLHSLSRYETILLLSRMQRYGRKHSLIMKEFLFSGERTTPAHLEDNADRLCPRYLDSALLVMSANACDLFDLDDARFN